MSRPAASLRPPVVFFGSDNFSLPSLAALHRAGWEIKAVVTKPDSPAGRGRRLTPPHAKVWAQEHGIAILQPEKLTEITDELNSFGVQLGAVASYGKLIPDKILDIFPLGLINVHPSLLPKYRGPAPIEAAILNGDAETGVSIMRVTHEMDAGPVYAQETVPLTGRETQPELYDQLAKIGAELLEEALPGIAAGHLEARPQNDKLAVTTSLIQKADGQIDWAQPAGQIERQIRAYLSWPGSRTELFGREILLTGAHAVPSDNPELEPGAAERVDGAIRVQTGSGTLCLDRLKPAGGREMNAKEFLSGIRQ